MALDRFSVCWSEFVWRDRKERRPCIVLSPQWCVESRRCPELLVALMSGAMDLFEPEKHFLISSSHASFPAIGLKRTSFVALDHITFVSRARLEDPVGRMDDEELQGRLLQALRAFLEL